MSDYVIRFDELESFYDEPGERGWILEGEKFGLSSISSIITETAPGGGPPVHTHDVDEIHVLPACEMRYLIAGQTFDALGPCIVRIPAGAPHTFTNRGSRPVSLVCFFPSAAFWPGYLETAPNPLL